MAACSHLRMTVIGCFCGQLFGGLHRARCVVHGRDAGEIRQAVVQQHGRLARLDGGGLARLDINRRVLLERLAGAGAGAREHQIDAVACSLEARAFIELEQARLRAALGPYAQQLLGHTRRALDRHPIEIRRIERDRRGVAALGVAHLAPVHVLPDRLVGIHVALAGDALAAMEDAVLELAKRLELLHAGLHLTRQQVARAAGAAELQHRAIDLGLVDLRAVVHALRIVAEHAGLERAILAVVRLAFNHKAVLIEIVPVARPGVVGAEPAERELEIARRAWLAFHDGAGMERAAAMLEAAHLGGRFKLDDFHSNAPALGSPSLLRPASAPLSPRPAMTAWVRSTTSFGVAMICVTACWTSPPPIGSISEPSFSASARNAASFMVASKARRRMRTRSSGTPGGAANGRVTVSDSDMKRAIGSCTASPATMSLRSGACSRSGSLRNPICMRTLSRRSRTSAGELVL